MNNFTKVLALFFASLSLTLSISAAIPNATEVGTYGSIQAPGSDSTAVFFNSFYSSTISPYLINHSSSGTLNDPGIFTFTNQVSPSVTVLNPTNNSIAITAPSTVRLYYINSSASFNNAFGLTNNTFTVNAGDGTVVFPTNQPLPGPTLGSFVDIPGVFENTTLNLFLLANMDTLSSQNIWWSNLAQNADSLTHVQVAQFLGGNGVLFDLIAWDDQQAGNTDRDFNDFTLVAQITPIAVPEPGFYLLMGSLLSLAYVARQRAFKKA